MAVAPDLLFVLRNNFYIGAFQATINSGDVQNLSQEDAIERDCLIYSSYIALGSYQLVINEVDSSTATPLQAVKLLALYFLSTDNKVKSPFMDLVCAFQICEMFILMHVVIGIDILNFNQLYKQEFSSISGAGAIFTFRNALNVQVFLKMHRFDYVEKQLRVMQQIDEDHTLTQLATAWLNLAVDFSEKYQMTSLILNGKAVCCMHMGNFDEAESFLLEALNKDAKDPETLANLIICRLHLGKPSSRFLSQLKLSHPEHRLIKRGSTAKESFDRAVQTV
ncbi:hypothetical protein R6Q59_028160 [Mikania micrantha]